jgi:type IX secretion system PorP/SprF family membrane protein
MFRNSIFFFLFLNLIPFLQCQDLDLYRNYQKTNFYNINPAAAGFDGAFISQITVSKKWLGISGSPANQVLSNSLRLGDEEFYDPNKFVNRPIINLAPRVGIGLTIFNETSGPLRITGVLFAYAYHISIRENRLSFGLSGLISQFHINAEEFKPVNSADPSLYSDNSAVVPDLNFGMMYYNSRLFTGISVNSLINYNKVVDPVETAPDILLCGGYKFKINYYVIFEPSLFIWKYGEGSFAADINTKLYIRDKFWFLASYQGNCEALAGIGLSIKTGIQLNYFYSINTNGLASYNLGSQCISLKADITALVRKYK